MKRREFLTVLGAVAVGAGAMGRLLGKKRYPLYEQGRAFFGCDPASPNTVDLVVIYHKDMDGVIRVLSEGREEIARGFQLPSHIVGKL